MAVNDELFRFTSVYFSQYSSESFLIPRLFYEHLPRRLPKIATLMGASERSYKVAMVSKREHVYFERGWSTFVVDHELKDGEILIFAFDGHENFGVSVYCQGGGCKETRASIQLQEISDDDDVGGGSPSDSFDTPPVSLGDDDTQCGNANDYSEVTRRTTKRQ